MENDTKQTLALVEFLSLVQCMCVCLCVFVCVCVCVCVCVLFFVLFFACLFAFGCFLMTPFSTASNITGRDRNVHITVKCNF